MVGRIAFLATDPETVTQRFAARGIVPVNRYLPEFQLYQMFIQDPNGLTVELNFSEIATGVWNPPVDVLVLAATTPSTVCFASGVPVFPLSAGTARRTRH